MKNTELEKLEDLLRLCREYGVASYEETKGTKKLVFYERDREAETQDAELSLDNPDEPGDPAPQRPQFPESPKLEAPYPPGIFADGQAPDFG